MCTRFFVDHSAEMQPYIEEAARSPLCEGMADVLKRNFTGYGEIRPTDIAAVIAPDRNGMRTVYPMAWGYHIPGISRPVVNARVETAEERPSFSADWRRHRCIIPASYYFEWEHFKNPNGKARTGDKYAIRPKGSSLTFLAGLYHLEVTQGFHYPVFTVLTREPGVTVARIHDRMPLILPEDGIDDWIQPDGNPEQIAENALTDMVLQKA